MNSRTLFEKIKLLIIVKSIDGGTGTFLVNLIKIKKLFTKNNFKIKILVLEKPTYRLKPVAGVEFLFDKDKYPKYYKIIFSTFLDFVREMKWVREKIKEHKPQIVLSIDIHSNLLVLVNKLIWSRNLKVVITTHNNLYESLISKSSRFLSAFLITVVKFLYPYADIVIGASKGVSKSLKESFNLKKIITIYDGVNTSGLATNPLRNISKKIIVSVMRLDEQKDVENLIRAFKILNTKISGVKLWIIGDGPKKEMLIHLSKQLKLEHKIVFMGWKTNIKKYFKKSSIFVLSSKREGWSYAILQGMMSGLPIVSTDSPYGPREILNSGKYGLLVSMANPHKMANAMYVLLTNKNKYTHYSRMSLRRVRYYSLENMIKTYKDIFIRMQKK